MRSAQTQQPYRLVKLSELAEPPAPVRAQIDEQAIVELAASIKAVGMLQPLIVVSLPAVGKDGGAVAPESGVTSPRAAAPKYEIVAGHRRYLAARLIGLEQVPCLVFSALKVAKEAVMLAENVYRVDLTAAEEGLFYAELIEKYDLTEAALCEMVHQSPEYIYARLDLVRGDNEVLHAVLDRKINFSVAKELNRAEDERTRRYLLGLAIQGGATASVVRQWVVKVKLEADLATSQPVSDAAAAPAGPSPDGGLRCFFCGGTNNPEHLRLLYIHFYEYDVVIKALAGLGIEVVG